MTSKVKVLSGFLVFNGWKGSLSIDGDVATINADDHSKQVIVNFAEVKSASFNSNNGMWVLKLKTGDHVRFQGAGGLLSADRTEAGEANNQKLAELIDKYRIRFFGV